VSVVFQRGKRREREYKTKERKREHSTAGLLEGDRGGEEGGLVLVVTAGESVANRCHLQSFRIVIGAQLGHV
jgi:hypothetical protein